MVTVTNVLALFWLWVCVWRSYALPPIPFIPTEYPSSRPSNFPSSAPSTTPSSCPSSVPVSYPSSKPSEQPSSSPSSRPSRQPSSNPSQLPSGHPSVCPTTQPSAQPSQPSGQPTSFPSSEPTRLPSSRPTRQPSVQPTACPSRHPTSLPSSQPVSRPSSKPSNQPSSSPTEQPSNVPSAVPSRQPTLQPTKQPSSQPSAQPSHQPVSRPTMQPSNQPSTQPSDSPTSRPSALPSNQPSRQPSMQPSSQPSRQPSGHPVSRPTVQPSSQPSAQPSSSPTGVPSTQPTSQPSTQPSKTPTRSPSCIPSSQPSSQPSTQPFSLPTSVPSTQPSSQPSSLPSSRPSGQPTGLPSRQPSAQPTLQPTFQPSSIPTGQPSTQPSARPTVQPSNCPSTQPSHQPSGVPSLQPYAVPSSMPSQQPTSQPSKVPDCLAGHHYEFTGINGTAQCLPCLPGYFAEPKSHECTITPLGHYAGVNASKPTPCPANSYSDVLGAFTCTSCGPGMVNSGLGNIDPKLCVNPSVSFGIAFFGLVICWIGIVLYILGGRLHRLAFLRKEVLVRRASMLFNIVCDQLLSLNKQYTELAIVKKHKKTKYMFLKVLYYTIAWSIVIGFILMFFIASLFKVFFTALILYRGYLNLPDIALPSLFERYSQYVQNFQIPYIHEIFYPFFYAMEVAATFNVTLASVSVSCIGAQIPMHLLVDCFVIGIVILVIESNVEVFWCTALTNVMEEYQKLILHPHFWKGRYCSNFFYLCWSVIVLCLPHPRKIIQYSLGFVRIAVFFNTNYHAAHSPNCDIAYPSIGTIGVDSLLALIASIIAYAAICPVIYIFSQILVPGFKLDPGTVRPEKYIRKRVHIMASKIITCPNCHLGLIAHITDYFGEKFHCDSSQCVHKDEAGVPILDTILAKTQTLYGCPCFRTCKWAICVDCYAQHMEAAEGEKKSPSNSGRSSPKNADQQSGKSGATMETRSVTPATPTNGKDGGEVLLGGGAVVVGADNRDRETTIVEIEKDKHCYTPTTHYGKLMAMFGAIDWFYVRFAYAFAYRICNTLATHLVQMKVEVDPESERSPPDLPWFQALDRGSDESEILRQEEEWTKFSASFPSYYRLCLTVQDDLMPKMTHHGICCNRCGTMPIVGHRYTAVDEGPEYNLCEHCECATMKDEHGRDVVLHESNRNFGRNCLRYLIAAFSVTTVGQLCSTRGRLIWRRVLINYYVFFMVIFGYWNQLETRDYQLKQWFEYNRRENAVIYHEAKTFEESPYLNTSKKQTENTKVLSALVSPRLVLLQLIPYMTVVSSFAVDVSSAPMLVFDPQLKGEVLPMMQWENADKIAREFLREVGASRKLSNVRLMTFYVIFTKSRVIQFCMCAVTNIIAMALVFTPSPQVVGVMTFSTIFFLIESTIYALYPFILLDRLLFPPEEDEVLDEEELKMREEALHPHEHDPNAETGAAEQPSPPAIAANKNFDGMTTETDDNGGRNECYRIDDEGHLNKVVPCNDYMKRYGNVA